MKSRTLITVALMPLCAAACTPTASQMEKLFVDNPQVLVKAIEANPAGVIESLNKAAQQAQAGQAEKQREAERVAREEEFKNPKKPKIDASRAMWGNTDAAVTIVEYSDFECPYCSRGYNTIKEVKAKYGDNVRVIYKHLPLDFHKMAMPAAEFFEAIAMQDAAKAYKFHELVFENQNRLKGEGDKFLEEMAQKAGANVAQAKKDAKSAVVAARIKEDMAEAKSFDIQGTPAFLINGVALKGAYPLPEFVTIIDKIVTTSKNG